MAEEKHTNRLIRESSPYLLQHAHNPVDWFPWGDEALAKAKAENKLMLVSVGYSACHWCHVMEHESFEDEKVARIMNDLFVCIKVDREERPDIDQVYMTAVQLMTGHGGWPLNCFTLPDGRPLYGGTYFQKERWMEILINLADLWSAEPEKCLQYAHELTEGVRQNEKLIAAEINTDLLENAIGLSVEQWSTRFDNTEGGPTRAPKFPLPNNYLFLLRYSALRGSGSTSGRPQVTPLAHVQLTLDKMAMGGIYDQIGGGFARYSTDMLWKVPHFEKMLYDNAQLVSLYSEAFTATKSELYKQVVYETLAFIARELTASNGAFYSALDADSEGEEGKFYTWTKEELEKLLGADFAWFADYFSVNSIGYRQEEEKYILLRREKDETIAMKYGLTVDQLKEKLAKAKSVLLDVRGKRVRPGLDDKTLTSWNALMLKGYVDAYNAFGEKEFLHAALKSARFIRDSQLQKNGALWHSWKNGKSSINGFLEDYAFVIEAFLSLYQAIFDEDWLQLAKQLAEYVITHFDDSVSGMFFFTSDEDAALITRKTEIQDNVIPASNSAMARNLFYLGHFFGKTEWIGRSRKMLACVQRDIIAYGSGYSNWMILQLHFEFPFREIAIVGNSVDKTMAALRENYLPNQIFAGSAGKSALPLLSDRLAEGKTLIYICENNSCQKPVERVEEALELLK